jgi:ribosomal protein S18 acetylase RimI-like enzyme
MSDLAVNIRVFRFPEDYETVIALWEQAGAGVHVGRSDTPDEIKKKFGRDPDLFLVAEVDGVIVGSVLGGFDGRRGMIYHLAVAQDHRQNGIGAILMEEVDQRLKQKGCIRSYLLVTRDNLDAIRFYEKRGWARMDLHIFGKDLS